jgi:hypothetical protein
MDDEQKLARIHALINEEQRTQPLHWLYLSYADEAGFRGGVIVMAHGFAGATFESSRRKLSPGGQVTGIDLPNEKVPPPKYRNRLLTLEDLKELWDMESLGDLQAGQE